MTKPNNAADEWVMAAVKSATGFDDAKMTKWHDEIMAIARAILNAAPTHGSDAQTFVGKWRDVIKAMPDTYAQGADARPVAIYQIFFAEANCWSDVARDLFDMTDKRYRRIVYATRDANPVVDARPVASDGPEVPWRVVVELAEKHGLGFMRSGWTFYCDDDLNAFAQAIAAIAPRNET